MMATPTGYHANSGAARQPFRGAPPAGIGKVALPPAPAPRRVIVLPHACPHCGGAIVTGAYRNPNCQPCVNCGRHTRCCPPRTPAQVVSDADTPDMAAVARQVLRRLAAGAAVADTGALAGLLGDVIAGPAVAPPDDADDAPPELALAPELAPAPQVAPRQLALAL